MVLVQNSSNLDGEVNLMKFYSVQIRESVEVPDDQVEVVTMKNGKLAAKAKTTHNGRELKLFKILSKEDAARLKK
ncbi:MAG: hypothetical protein N2558_04000 [Patescibacteria group bacterium]|nr:hypothetical protein [Patescibacteria group bacterium]